MKYLITGPPGCGKTTLLKKFFLEFKKLNPSGFYTEEIREKGKRVGFAIFDSNFKFSRVLAHISFSTNYKVSKYCVDVEGFELFLQSMNFKESKIVLIDEIGKMETLSEHFKNLILEVLKSDKIFIGTIALKGTPFIESIKKIECVKLFSLEYLKQEVIFNKIRMEIWQGKAIFN